MNSQSETGSKAVRSVGDSSDRIAALAIGHAAYDLCMVVDAYPPENSKAQTELLIESGLLVKQVAEQLGFSDPYNFSRAFKATFGLSPANFIQRAKRS